MLYQHFWLLCGLWFGVSNGLFLLFRLRKLASPSTFTAAEAASFAKWTALSIFVPAFIFWGLQQSAGITAKPNFLEWPAPQKQLALGFQVLVWIAMLVYVFPAGGADTLSRYLSAGRTKLKFLYTPKAFKVITAGTVASQIATVTAGMLALGTPV
jgi:hypothetical protein